MFILKILVCAFFVESVSSAVNVALNKPVDAMVTCGTYGDEIYQLNSEVSLSSSQRQSLTCIEGVTHRSSFLVDGYTNTSWQSASRFLIYDRGFGKPDTHLEATILLDLEQEFQVEIISLDMSESIQPNRIEIQKSLDGNVFTNWLYRVTLAADCQTEFGISSTDVPIAPQNIICTTFFNTGESRSDVLNRKVTFDISKQSDAFRKARYLRISFYEMNFETLGPTGNNFQHYTVRELTVMANCLCFGHDISCDKSNVSGRFECVCGDNTQGAFCQQCQPIYNQREFQPDVPCERCNCFGHAAECVYNPVVDQNNGSINEQGLRSGGGVCINCQNNTDGVNCETCADRYYRPLNKLQTDSDACVQCECVMEGSAASALGGVVGACVKNVESAPENMVPGQCFCKANVEGLLCDQCMAGFYNLLLTNPLGCQECMCELSGTIGSSNVCNTTSGQCPCKENVMGGRCNICQDGYYQLTSTNPQGCLSCGCDIGGVTSGGCDKSTGQCQCLSGIGGLQCDRPLEQFFYPELHYIFAEAETPTGKVGLAANNAGFTGYGYAILESNDTLLITLRIDSKIPPSQLFYIVIKYNSPTSVAATIQVSGQAYDVTFPPCTTGWCYLQMVEAQLFSPLAQVLLTIQASGSVLIDRVVAIPTEFMTGSILGESASSFATDCNILENGSNLDVNQQSLCESKIFSVVVNALSGGVFCDCHLEGSVNLICENNGGQCLCKDGVGGRKCDQCLPDHYQLTSTGCKPCNCAGSNKQCDSNSGQCYCSPNATGRQCNLCENFHFNWREVEGCQACDCGMGSTSAQCNQTTGQCNCHTGVEGMKCDRCQAEFKSLSRGGCVPCNCDPLGSNSTICDPNSGQCPCKDNVVGPLCNQCSATSFDLSPIHPKGCADCVCMGITSSCQSSQKLLQQITVSLLNETTPNFDGLYSIVTAQLQPVDGNITGKRQLFESSLTVTVDGSPELFWNLDYSGLLGDGLDLYGSNLEFGLSYSSTIPGDNLALLRVILVYGDGSQLTHTIPEPLQFNMTTIIRAPLLEGEWMAAGQPINRAQFLLALSNINTWLLPVTLLSGNHISSLSNVMYTIASSEFFVGERAIHVEDCNCGEGYIGSSCQNCAAGFKRFNVSSHEFLGVCVRCECNSHSIECDPHTGVCLNCQQNTQGVSCELCQPGFYGDPLSPAGCSACPCFLPRVSDTSCEDVNGTVTCLNCNPGYTQPRCDRCEPFYYGQPEIINVGTCTICECNGNSNDCDTLTGQCLNCAGNTTGFNCERCLDGFYGNASNQNCQSCECVESGSSGSVCDHITGQCPCLPGVGQLTCSRCELGFWGYLNNTFPGCEDCLCNAEGSTTVQCEETTAVCPCKANTGGEKCDSCNEGFWGLPNQPCSACQCNSVGTQDLLAPCDRISGQCICKEGVEGRSCDQCKLLYTGFGPNGCTKCGQCEDSLGNDTVLMSNTFTIYWQRGWTVSLIQEQDKALQNISSALTAAQSSPGYSTLLNLQGLINNLTSTHSDLSSQVNSLQLRLDEDLRQTTTLSTDSSQEKERFQTLVTASGTANQKSQEVLTVGKGYVTELSDFQTRATNLLQSTNVSAMNLNMNFSEDTRRVNGELTESQNVLNQVYQSQAELNTQNLALQEEEQRDINLETQTIDLRSQSSAFQNDLNLLTSQKNDVQNFYTEIQGKMQISETQVNNTKSQITTANQLLQASTTELTQAQSTLEDCLLILGENPNNLPLPLNVSVDITGLVSWPVGLTSLSSSLNQTELLIQQTQTTSVPSLAAQLQIQAQQIQSDFNSVISLGNSAVSARQNYENAVSSLQDSLRQVQAANEAVSAQTAALAGVNLSTMETTANNSRAQSESLLNQVNSKTYQPQILEAELVSSESRLMNADRDWTNLITQITQVERQAASLQPTNTSLTVGQVTAAESNSQVIISALAKTMTNDQSLSITLGNLMSESLVIQNESQNAVNIVPTISNKVITFTNSLTTVENLLRDNNNIYQRINSTQSSIMSRLNDLEAKVQQAKQIAEKLKQPVLFPSAMSEPVIGDNLLSSRSELGNKVSLEFKVQNSFSGLLFFVENRASASEFSLELTNGSVLFHFTINLERVQMTSQAEIIANQWYRVQASRSANSGQLTVTNLSTGGTAVINRDGVSLNARNMTLNSDLFIGGLPTDYQTTKVMSEQFEGCMYNVLYGGQPVPIWQLRVNSAQARCCRKPVYFNPIPSISGTELSGFSYLEILSPALNTSFPSEISIRFRTFISDGVLFIIEAGQSYFGVFLLGGKLQFSIQVSSQSASIQSTEVYNDGQWYMVSTRLNDTIQGMVINYGVNGSFFERETISSHPLTSPIDVSLFLGRSLKIGSIQPDPTALNLPVTSDFSGHVEELMVVVGGTLNPVLVSLTDNVINEAGVYRVIPEQIDRGLSFYTDMSYAELTVPQARNIKSISLLFMTYDTDGILYYTTASNNPEVLLYVALRHGNIVLYYNEEAGGTLKGPVETKGLFLSDGVLHDVTVNILTSFRVQLKVDDITVEDNVRILSDSIAFGNGDIYLGGIPAGLQLGVVLPVKESLQAGINSLSINNGGVDLLNHLLYVRQEGVSLAGIARPLNSPLPPPYTLPDNTTILTSCLNPAPSARYLDNGVRFGESPVSFQSHQLTSDQLIAVASSFVLTIQFRSFVSAGTLFYMADRAVDPTQWFSVYLIDGFIKVSMSTASSSSYLLQSVENQYNQGDWWEVDILRINNFLAIVVSDQKDYNNNNVNSTIPSTITLDPSVYIGGLDSSITGNILPAIEIGKTPLIGCIRQVEITPPKDRLAPFTLDLNNPSSNGGTGRCFSNAAPGIRLTGSSSYIELNQDYTFQLPFTFEMEIRTVVRSGNLMTIYQSANQFVVLDLYQGQIRCMIGNAGNRDNPLIVTSENPANLYSLCNNEVHLLRLEISDTQLLLQVDTYTPQVTFFPNGFTLPTIQGSFNIAGFTADREASLIFPVSASLASFTGCMNSVMINQQTLDPQSINTKSGVLYGCFT